MGLRDDLYTLRNEIELDDGFFETVNIRRDYIEPLKEARGSRRQTTVLVMAESKEVQVPEDESHFRRVFREIIYNKSQWTY
jgi:stalled ribosome rescue protein Dom34